MSDFTLIARWQKTLRVQNYSPRTIRLYSIGVYRFFSEVVGDSPATATRDHVVDFLDSLDAKGGAKVKYLTGIRSFYAFLIEEGVVSRDPTANLRLRKPKARDPDALTERELYDVFCAAHNRDPRRAWTLMLSFGLGTRRMELAGITPEDVQGDEVELRHCKGGKTRKVPISNIAREALKQLKPWWNGTVLGGISEQTITGWGEKAAREAGVYRKARGRTTHIFRATYATYLLNSGTPIQVVRCCQRLKTDPLGTVEN